MFEIALLSELCEGVGTVADAVPVFVDPVFDVPPLESVDDVYHASAPSMTMITSDSEMRKAMIVNLS